ncbi:unnamed protein product, partial [Ectocarpus fasciculatus]
GLVIGSLLAALLGLRWMRELLNPDSDLAVETAKLVEDVAFLIDNAPAGCSSAMTHLTETLGAMEDVSLRRIRSDAVGFFVGSRQLAHIHPSGHIDLPLPVEIGEALVAQGTVEHHRLHDSAGWYTHPLHDSQDVETAEWLLRLAHALYEIKQKGDTATL